MARVRRRRVKPTLICEDKKICECKAIINPKKKFDPKSFRIIKHPKPKGARYVMIGCPKKSWDSRKKYCKVGTMAYKVTYPLEECK